MTTSNGDTAWRSSAEAADAGAGDAQEADWCATAQRTVRARSDDITITDAGGDTNRTERVHERALKRRALSTVTRRRTAQPASRAAQPTTTASVDMAGLVRRVERLESWRLETEDARLAAIKAEFVEDRNTMWKFQVLRLLRHPLRNFNPMPGRPFTTVLRTDVLTVREDMSFMYFQEMAREVASRGPVFRPSLEHINDPSADMAEAHIMFPTASAMLDWVGVTSKADKCALMQRTHKTRNGMALARVLGGLQ